MIRITLKTYGYTTLPLLSKQFKLFRLLNVSRAKASKLLWWMHVSKITILVQTSTNIRSVDESYKKLELIAAQAGLNRDMFIVQSSHLNNTKWRKVHMKYLHDRVTGKSTNILESCIYVARAKGVE